MLELLENNHLFGRWNLFSKWKSKRVPVPPSPLTPKVQCCILQAQVLILFAGLDFVRIPTSNIELQGVSGGVLKTSTRWVLKIEL